MEEEKKVKAESFQDIVEIMLDLNIRTEKRFGELFELIKKSIEIRRKIDKELKDYKAANDVRVTLIEKDVHKIKKVLQIIDE